MAELTFGNGAKVSTDLAIEAAGKLLITLYGVSITDAVKIADNPENVRKIVHSNGGTFEGYTNLLCIAKDGDQLRLTLGKAEG